MRKPAGRPLFLIFVCLLVTSSRAARAACPDFSPAVNISLGPSFTSPYSSAIGDLNGDGKLDLVIANSGANTLSILLGNGDGTFGAASTYVLVNAAPKSVAIADFNGDGKLDLAVANFGTNNVSILPGNGDGTFGTKTDYAVGGRPYYLAVGDLNGDGRLDIVTANSDTGNLSILLGNGSGAFPTHVEYTVGAGPQYVAIGDFNGDGKPDLVAANSGAATVSVLLGNSSGNGTFGAKTDYGVGNTPTAVVAGDFNGDGKLDLAVANVFSNNVSILLGNGSGSFASKIDYGAGTKPNWISVRDFNGDGKLDLAVTNFSSDNVSILSGVGDGSFLTPANYGVGSNPQSVSAGDFDGDGKADLAVVNYSSDNLSILLNKGLCFANCGTFAAATNSNTGTFPYSVAVGDFNGDGKPDLVVANTGSGNVTLLLATGPGTFAGTNFNAGNNPRSVAVGDFNHDGKLDIAVANAVSNDVSVLLGNGSGSFAAASNYSSGAGTGPFAVAVGDFNRDGILDLAVANTSTNNVSIFLGTGTGMFGAATRYPAGSAPGSIAVADFDGDGKLDLAVANSAGAPQGVSILLGDGNGGFGAPNNYAAGVGPQSVAVGDFDGDGKLDLVVANYISANVSILLGNGNGSFNTADNYGAGSGATSIAVGDFNGDGKLDVATANEGSNVSVLFGNGSGAFANAVNYLAGSAPESVAIGDFNGDGKLDLAVANFSSANASVLLSTCPPPDLTVTKTHTPNFTAGEVGATYTIDVHNIGTGPMSGLVTVIDSVPAFMTVTGLAGTGWTCTIPGATCTRSSALAGGGTYPSITLTVDVASNTPPSVTNHVDVSGGNEINLGNDTADDVTAIGQIADLTVSKNHTSAFRQGGTGTYLITVSNIGLLPTSGTVTVTDTVPAGLTATAIDGGTAWNCVFGTLTCTRSDALAAGSSYSAIAVFVNIDNNAAATVTNTAVVSGGGEGKTSNDTATDITPVVQAADLTITKSHSETFTQGDTLRTYVITVSNPGPGPTVGTVTVTDPLPPGLTLAQSDLPGWTCSFAPITCFRSDVLAAGASYPPITIRVNVDANAVALVTNTATVSGGGELNTANDVANDPTPITQLPDLTVTKTHSGSFTQGQTGATYTITVNNAGAAPTNGTVTVIDTLSLHLTATAIAGAGWSCDLPSLTCTRNDVLAASSSYSAITVTVNVANNAPSSVTNDVTVSGGGEIITSNDGASDPTAVTQLSDLTVAKSHSGNFTQGQLGATYTITVSNDGTAPTAGTVTLIDTLPLAGLTATAIGGTGWSCDPAGLTCTRVDPLAAGSSYPAIIVTVNVTTSAPSSVNNTATVSGGGEVITMNDVVTDGTLITQVADLVLSKTHSGSFTQGQTGATYTLMVQNIGPGSTSGTVSVTDTLPSTMTATAISGLGWTCTVGTRTCTRSDALQPGFSFPPITLTVSVALNATSVTNTAAVSMPGELFTGNNSASDPTTVNPFVLVAPANLIATATSATQVSVTWNAVTGAVSYQLFRSSHNGSMVMIATPATNAFSDSGLSANTTYLYRVKAVDGSNNVGPQSGIDLATTILFTDDPIVAGTTAARAIHLLELRTAVNAVRAAAGLSQMTFTDVLTAGVIIKAAHVTELRSNLDAARSAIGVTALSYTDPGLAAGGSIMAAHVQELRTGVK